MKSMHGFEITFAAVAAERFDGEKACRSSFSITGSDKGLLQPEQGSVEQRTKRVALDEARVIGERLAEYGVHHVGTDPHGASHQEIKPYDPYNFLHHLAHKNQDRERGQRAPIGACLQSSDPVLRKELR